MSMRFDYPTLIENLTDEQKIRFYELFAHNLTVSVRAIWSDENITDAQKLECLKWMNEILHQVTEKFAYLRLSRNEFSESESWESIKHWISVYPMIGGHVGWAIKTSYEFVSKL